MFIDCLDLEDGSVIETDVAIIGAGMAGISLASELNAAHRSVCLLESGGLEPEVATNELCAGSMFIWGSAGSHRRMDEYLQDSRSRYHGGTGNAWGGKCARLDPMDLSERAWIEESGWPFDYAELQPYYERASQMLRIPSLDKCRRLPEYGGRHAVRLHAGHNFETDYRCHTSVTGNPASAAFEAYKADIAAQVPIYLHANVAQLHVNENGSRVQSAAVKCLNGRSHRVQAKRYVLAAGGIENARILLSSDDVLSAGVGNEYDQVGRYFNGHAIFRYLHGPNAESCLLVKNEGAPDLGMYSHGDPTRVEGFFRITRKAQFRERIAGFAAMLEPPIEGNAAAHPIFFTCEQVPNAQSSIILSEERDALGMRRTCLHWRFTPRDTETLEKGVRLFATDVEKCGLGRLTQNEVRADLTDIMESSRHHMGTTRMHTSCRRGVVDPDAKIHGIENAYVAGSSVFPTSGVANPTLTILALTFRLAWHLKQEDNAHVSSP